MSFSISFLSKTPFLKGKFLSQGRRTTAIKMASATLTTTIPITPLTENPQSYPNTLQLKNNSYIDSLIQVNGFHESSLAQLGSISDENFINVSIENEIRELVERLERVVEEFRIFEMEKLMSKAKRGGEGEMIFSVEEAEIMSREIVCKFLEKPMKYLTCENVKPEDKLKDLMILVRLLEDNSCLGKQEDDSKRRRSCLRHSFS